MKRFFFPGPIIIAFCVLMVIALAIASPRQSRAPAENHRPFDADARVDAVFQRACANCHSNETRWPWYAQIPPVSRLIGHDVEKGREHLNFSEPGPLSANRREEIYDAVADHSMPPKAYVLFHPEASLSREDLSLIELWSK